MVRAFLPRDIVPLEQPIALVDERTGERIAHHEEVVPPRRLPTRPIGRHVSAVVRDLPGYGYAFVSIQQGDAVETQEIDETIRERVLPGELRRPRGLHPLDLRPRWRAGSWSTPTPRGRLRAVRLRPLRHGPHFNHMSGHVGAHDRTLLGDRAIGRHAAVVKAERTAIGEKLVVELQAKGADWVRTTIELHAGVPRLDLTYQLAKQGTPAKEAVFVAFPFAQ
ncbi:hypothetical protein GCM10020219_067880 [Nonomuraea dietziae]